MKINDLKKLLLDLIIPPNDEFVKKIRRWEKIFNSNFSLKNAYEDIEISWDDILDLENDPNIESNAIKIFFEKALPFYTPENCFLLTSNKPAEGAMNERELFLLFKKIFAPFPEIEEAALEELIRTFNSNFDSEDFYEILYEQFYWDEIYEDPDLYDEDIKKRIREELLNKDLT